MSALSKVSRELDFSLLGGNRPDVEVAMAVTVSMANIHFAEKSNEADDQPGTDSITSENSTLPYGSLPPDVLEQALAIMCIPTVTTTASKPVAASRDMCRLRPKSLDDVKSYCTWYQSVDSRFLENCKRVYSIDLTGRGIKLSSVGNFFLANCTQLRTIRFPAELSFVGDNFLRGCSKLLKLDFSSTTISNVGNNFLFHCEELRAIRLPAELSSVGDNFLWDCSKLSELDLSNTKISSVRSFLADCTALRALKLPATLSSVGDNVLNNCRQLSELDLSSTTISSVGNDFLYRCTELRKILLRATLSSVGDYFLSCCSQLSELDLSSTKLCTIGTEFLFMSREQCCVRMPNSMPTQSNLPSEWWSNDTQNTGRKRSRSC